jgi:hypothetical protein
MSRPIPIRCGVAGKEDAVVHGRIELGHPCEDERESRRASAR